MAEVRLSDWLKAAEGRLRRAGIESARLEAQMLAAHVLLVDRSWLLAHPEAGLNELAAEGLLQRREAAEPLAYILGWREFYGRRFAVRPGVLIPRHETELLVDLAKDVVGSTHARVLDVGTGSGCIAVSVALECPSAQVTAVDISPIALEIASENGENLVARVDFKLSDGFTELLGESFDLILSNPPYIADHEQLSAEVRDHEPASALFSGATGLEFYQRLAREAMAYLNSGGLIAVEVGHTQAEAVRRIFLEHRWSDHSVLKDLQGISRVVAMRSNFPCAVPRKP